MIVAGILMVGLVPSNGLINIQNRGITKRIGRRLLAPKGKFTLGLTLGFLPCGLIYAALLKAVDAQAVSGVLYNGDKTLRKQANDLFDDLNSDGSVSS